MSEPLNHLTEHFQALLNRRQFDDILNYAYQAESTKHKRIYWHFCGMTYALQGLMQQALEAYLEATKFGKNIQLDRDICCAYYQLEEVDQWRKSYNQLNQTLNLTRQALSNEAIVTTKMTLAKFYEEEGCIEKALGCYQRLVEEFKLSSPSIYYFSVAPQLLRLKSLKKADAQMSILYTQLLSSSSENISDYLGFEIEHSLMLAELNLIGPEHAFGRVKAACEQESLSPLDRRLICFDYLEECFLKYKKNSPKAIALAEKLIDNSSIYEKEVFHLLNDPAKKFDVLKFNQLAKYLPIGSWLRLMVLTLAVSSDSHWRWEIKNRVLLVTQGLPQADQEFWKQRINSFQANQELEIEIDLFERNIMFHNSVLNVSRKKLSFQVLKLLTERPQWSIEEAISAIWSSSYTPEHFNRLRMSVHRTNQILQELTAFEKCIELSGDLIGLNPKVNLKVDSKKELKI